MSEYADSLLAFKAAIKHKGLLDWLEAHTSFMRPLHRYVGTLVVDSGMNTHRKRHSFVK